MTCDWNNIFCSFGSALAGAGFGSGLAFWLNTKKENNQIEQENISYLTYSITINSQLINNLYCYKKQLFLDRIDEINYLENFVQTAHKELEEKDTLPQRPIDRTFKYLCITLQESGLSFPVEIEKLSFLSKLNPNLITLLMSVEHSIKNFNTIVNQLNTHICTRHSETFNNCSLADLEKLLSYNKNFGRQIDNCLALAEMLNAALIEFGKRKYKKQFSITGVNFVDPEYENLKPPPLSDWEAITKWTKGENLFKNLPERSSEESEEKVTV